MKNYKTKGGSVWIFSTGWLKKGGSDGWGISIGKRFRREEME
jgi:hypothetical protein